MLHIEEIFLPSMVTARASGFNLSPWQASHGVICIKLSYSAFDISEAVSRYLLLTFSIMPSKGTS